MSLNIRLTAYLLGRLLLFLGGLLLTPIPFSLYFGESDWLCFLISSGVTVACGGGLFTFFRCRDEFTLREGFAIVGFGWITFALFGSLPYLCAGVLTNPVDAVFESMSGFTTVGATVFSDVESVPKGILFWRALTQWLGGMGIIVLGVAILPLLGVGGMELFNAESSGPKADRLTPRIQDTARILWEVYALLTGFGVVLLWVGDMSFFDALCHAFAAIATGGFSTRNESLGAFDAYTRVVTIVLMILGGISFSLHYHALKGKVSRYWKSEELKLFLAVLGAATLVVFASNWDGLDGAPRNLLNSLFNVASILTTTGFAASDYEAWPVVGQAILFVLMIAGACAGSTAGGLKQVRVLLLIKHAFLQTTRLIHPRRIQPLRLDHQPVSREVMQGILGFTLLFLGTSVAAFLVLTATGIDLVTAGSGVIACMTTVGPGLGAVGPLDNYGALPAVSKITLTLCMLLGRLEISTLLVLLYPSFWRR